MRNCLALLLALTACDGSRRGGDNNNNNNNGGPDMALPTTAVVQTVIAPGAPANAPTLFSGPSDPSLGPALVYPPDGVIMPPNLSDLEFQFLPAAGTTVFELHLRSTYLDLTIYTPCNTVGTGCGYLPDDATWQLISAQARGSEVTVELRATSSSGGAVGSAAPRKMGFTDEDLLGGLYYWAAASGAVNRYDFGRRGQVAENFYTPITAGAICVGCHALSHDGTRIAVGLNDPTPATLRVLDVASKTKLFDSTSAIMGGDGGSNFEAISPDAKYVLTTLGADLVLRDAASGTITGTNPAITNGTMPDWSTDGSQVAFARGATISIPFPIPGGLTPVGIDQGSIYTSSVSGTSFGTPNLIVQGSMSQNNYYPSLSPDGTLIAFNRSTMNSYDAPDATVQIIPSSGGTPTSLNATNMNQGNSWPKFAPFVHHYQGKTIFWLTFSSRRDYGLRIVNSATPSVPGTAQVWMVAVPGDASEIGVADYPPFWLPFQDPTTGNHIAQWTQTVARQPCSPIDGSGCNAGETCDNGQCIGAPIY
jgi:hypothetical protein